MITTAADAARMAAAALTHWPALAAPARLIKARENIVFEVRFRDGTRGALRLHRPGYQSPAAITAELDWTNALAEAGLRVPRPLATQNGAWLAEAEGRLASLVGWLDGQPMGEAGVTLPGSPDQQARLFHALGGLLARLHAATDALPPGIGAGRPAWDGPGLTGDTPLWGRFWDNPAFQGAERDEIMAARTMANERLTALSTAGADFGLIHADVLRENVLVRDDGLALIDFDDSGFGFRLYDLGTALVQNLEEPGLAQMAAALADGYRAGRPSACVDGHDLAFFTLMRCLASAGWIAGRATAEDPRQSLYAARALRLARHVRAGTLPWSAV